MAFRQRNSGAAALSKGGFRSPSIVKGRLTNRATQYWREFQFNPATIDRKDGWAWGSHGIPGSSHPIISGGHGEQRTISFELYLDADRGRSEFRRHGLDNDGTEELTFDQIRESSLDLTDEIKWYQSFTYPAHRTDAESLVDRGPYRMIFNFGPMFRGVQCVMGPVTSKVIQWTPKLEPMKAVLSIELIEVIDKPVEAGEVFSEPFKRSRR